MPTTPPPPPPQEAAVTPPIQSSTDCQGCLQPSRRLRHIVSCQYARSSNKRHASPANGDGRRLSRHTQGAPRSLGGDFELVERAESPRPDTTSHFEGLFTTSRPAARASPADAASATAGPSILTLPSSGTTAAPADAASELSSQHMHASELHEQQRVAEVAGDGAAAVTPLATATTAGEAARGAQEGRMVKALPKWEALRHRPHFKHLEGSSRRATDDDVEPTGSIVRTVQSRRALAPVPKTLRYPHS